MASSPAASEEVPVLMARPDVGPGSVGSDNLMACWVSGRHRQS
jgi:hypothetical protein